MKLNIYQKACSAFLLFLFVFWIVLYFTGSKTGFYNYLFSFLFGLIPLFGGIAVLVKSRMWGGLKSAVGKGVFFLGLGLFLWGSGETIWSCYNFFLNEPAPYPSLADLGFAPSIFFYGLGAAYLAKATGAKYGWQNKRTKIFTLSSILLLIVVSYYILVVVARGGILVPDGESPLKTVLDIAYPLGDFLALVIAVVISGLSFKYLGGRYKVDIYAILLGLGVMFIADAIFSYTTITGTFYNGSFGDLILTIGLFFLTFGTLGFCVGPKAVSEA